MPKGNFLETPGMVAIKDDRTEKMLARFNLDSSFLDPKLPSGYFSNSQYNKWLMCGKAYEYRYILHEAEPTSVAMSRGTSLHSGVEHLLKAKMANTLKVGDPVAVAKDIAANSFEEKTAEITDWEDTPKDSVKDAIVDLIDVYAKYALPKINPVAVEKGFAKKVGDVPVVGWIDLIDEQPALDVSSLSPEEAELAPKRRIVADLKTSKSKWSQTELDNDPQLTLYAIVEGTPDVRVDQLLLTKKKTFMSGESTRSPQQAAVYTDHLNEVVDYIKKGVFPKTHIDNWMCNSSKCPYFAKCRGKRK